MFLKVCNQIGKIHKYCQSNHLYSYIDQILRHRVWNLNHQGCKDRSLESNFTNTFFKLLSCSQKTYLSKVHQNIPALQSE